MLFPKANKFLFCDFDGLPQGRPRGFYFTVALPSRPSTCRPEDQIRFWEPRGQGPASRPLAGPWSQDSIAVVQDEKQNPRAGP